MIADFFIYDFLKLALIGTILLSLSSGLLSPLVVAKRYAFMGSALSHSTLLGVAVALSILEVLPSLTSNQGSLLLFFITFLTTLLIVSILARSTFRSETPNDSLIGIFLAASMGLSVIVHQLFVTTGTDLMSFLFGQIILLTQYDILIAFSSLVIIGLVIILKINQWRAITFDEDTAHLMGVNTKFYHYLFYILLTMFVVSGVKLSGTILINSLLLAPGIFAFKRAKSLKQAFVYATLFSLTTAVSGLVLANKFDFPPGATMATLQCFCLFIDGYLKRD